MANPDVDHSRDGDSRVAEIYAILSIGGALTTIVVALRLYTRTRLLSSFGTEDAFMIAAQALAIGTAIAIALECKYGLGRHTWTQPEEHIVPYMKAFYSSIVLYNVAMCLVKLSISFQYRRIFTNKVMQRLTTFSIAFFAAWTIMISFLLTLICFPVAKFWEPTIEGRCLNSLTVWYIMASFNLATDIALFIMPLPVIGSLQLPKRQKYTLVIVFGLGLFTCIISTIRLGSLKAASNAEDPNWDNVEAAYLSFLEVCTAILAASLPTLRPVLGKVMPSFFATRSHGSTPGHYAIPSSGYGKNSIFRRATTAPSAADSTRTLNKDDEVELNIRDVRDLREDGQAQHMYSVSVMGGGRGDVDTVSISAGIKTTTVVSQQVSQG